MGIGENTKKINVNYWQEIAIFFVLWMVLSWLVPWYQWFIDPSVMIPTPITFLLLCGILLSTYIAVRFATLAKFSHKFIQVIMIFSLVVWGWVGLQNLNVSEESGEFRNVLTHRFNEFTDLQNIIPDEAIILLVVIYLWHLGSSLARMGLRQQGVLGQFRIGIAMFVLYAFGTSFSQIQLPIGYLFLFFTASLLGMASSRIAMINRFRGGASVRLASTWLAGIVSSTLIVVSIAIFSATKIGGEFGRNILGIFQSLIYFLSILAISPLIFLVQLLAGDSQPATILPTPTPEFFEGDLETPAENTMFDKFPEEAGEAILDFTSIQSWIIWGVIFIIVVLILRNINRKQKKGFTATLSYQEDLEQRSLLDSLIDAWNNPKQMIMERIAKWRGVYNIKFLAAFRVRKTYAEFMNLCLALGVPRIAALTPLEFVPIAAEVFIEHEKDIELITATYLKVRYGEIPDNDEEFKAFDTAWSLISNFGKAQIKIRKKFKKKN